MFLVLSLKIKVNEINQDLCSFFLTVCDHLAAGKFTSYLDEKRHLYFCIQYSVAQTEIQKSQIMAPCRPDVGMRCKWSQALHTCLSNNLVHQGNYFAKHILLWFQSRFCYNCILYGIRIGVIRRWILY